MKKTTKEQKELLDEMYKETGIDIAYILENDKPETIDELVDLIEEEVSEIQVIYYSNAIKYLAENDPSLTECLALANEYCYEFSDLDSETLATILKQEKAKEALPKYRTLLDEAFYN